MKDATRLWSTVALASLVAALVLPVFTTLGLAATSPCPTSLGCGVVKGAPGPIAGAGLPILAIGYGVYWIFKRRRVPSSGKNPDFRLDRSPVRQGER
jgi:hypothetical protein